MTARRRLRQPLRNTEIAQKFEAIADMLAMQSANPFRVRAYQNAARTLRRYGREAADMISGGEDLSELEGIGKDLAGKIADLALTGTTDLYEELAKATPKLSFELLQLPGLGPKRVHALIDELGVKTLAQVRRAAREGRVRNVPGFGEKSEADLLRALSGERAPPAPGARTQVASAPRRTLAEVSQTAETLLTHLRAAPGVEEAAIAGSFRRGRESVGDLDFVVAAERSQRVIEHFTNWRDVKDVIGAGGTRATVILKGGLQADVRVVRPASFGAALLYFTGSKPHNIALRGRCRARGLKLNEYGLYRGAKRISGKTEPEIYRALALDYVPPELREARGEIEAAAAHRLPSLVESTDIKGDLHLSLARGAADLLEAARKRGLSYLVMAAPPGSSRYPSASAPQGKVALLHAVEAHIRADGSIEGDSAALSRGVFVIASVESDFNLPRARQTERLLAAISHPRVAMLAHPTCRVIGRREPLNADWPRIFRAAAEKKVALELSGDPARLDLTDLHCRMARDAGAKVALSSSALGVEQLGQMHFALLQARRGWLEAGDVLNSMPAARAAAWLQRPAKSRA